jgi:hypothetical protein
MKRTAWIATALLLTSRVALAAPSWSVVSFTTTPQNAPKILAAADKLMSSGVGKQFPGKLLLQVHLADGNNPSTHSFVPIYKTAAEREAFAQKMQADRAWSEFLAVMVKESQPVSTVWYKTLKSWGDLADSDRVWAGYAFKVNDPAAFLAALEKFMASETGKKFPGQVYLSGVVAGGLSPVTHMISVGFASETEMDAWDDARSPSADWATYLGEVRKVSEYLGNELARDLKSWGPATLKGISSAP